MTLETHARLGPYDILCRLGAGGMGEVYRARDTRLDRDVAIKVLPEAVAHNPEALARFEREARAVAALSHPNILVIHELGTEQGTLYAVMELLEGQSLGQRLKETALDWRTALAIGLAVVDGLAAAHARGIIHRDVKPDNIFLTTDGGVKVLDFGLARLENPAPQPAVERTVSWETQPGMVMGTVAYMSPEQVRGQPADARSDLFAFGCMFHEMLTGQRPFDAATNADMMAAILDAPPRPFRQAGRDVPPALERVVLRCLEKKPAERFQSARELAVLLRSIAREAQPDVTAQQDTLLTGVAHPSAASRCGQSEGPSVAVLPFVNMSSDKENEYFSDGLAEELIAVLSRVEGLHVASRTSAFAFKGKNEDVRKIGEQLNVRTVLEGSVRKSGNRLRISAQLVNVADGYHLWSETYNRQLADVFEIQDEIAQSIARALRGILTEKDRRALEKVQAADVQAYDFYLRGRQFFHQFRRQGFEFARQMFAEAIAIDPTYARAHAGMADCHSLLYMYWDPSEANLRAADTVSRKALELAPDLAEAHVARGLAVSLQKQFDEASQAYETAIRLDPNLFEARYFYGRACLAQGKLDEAAQLFEQAGKIRPDDYQAASHLASIYAGLGRKTDSHSACLSCLQVVERHLHLHPDDARALCLGAVAWSQLGEPARALHWAARALAIDRDEPLTLYNVACVNALQGKSGQALDCLEMAVKHGFAHKAWVEHDADLKSLRGQPRYEALLQRM